MARIRTIKPEFWADEKMSLLDPLTRLVFLGLVSMADDAGRLHDNVKILDAAIFPNTDDTVRDSLATLSRIGRVVRGTTKSGQKVIQITNWKTHQKVDHPNLSSCLPEIVDIESVTPIRETFANDSRDVRETVATHTNDQRPTTNDHIALQATPKSKEKKEPSKPRQRDVIIDALAKVHGINPNEITSSAGGMLAKAKADIVGVTPNVTPQEIYRRFGILKKHRPDPANHTAPNLAKLWGMCGDPIRHGPAEANPSSQMKQNTENARALMEGKL